MLSSKSCSEPVEYTEPSDPKKDPKEESNGKKKADEREESWEDYVFNPLTRLESGVDEVWLLRLRVCAHAACVRARSVCARMQRACGRCVPCEYRPRQQYSCGGPDATLGLPWSPPTQRLQRSDWSCTQPRETLMLIPPRNPFLGLEWDFRAVLPCGCSAKMCWAE